ncbi:MAG TPA: DUF423 domain-containing protein [Candidatus Acidoferrum sp.]|nr:DUF423 domain-containing protein [Candidatus Acidoferrum sp.]
MSREREDAAPDEGGGMDRVFFTLGAWLAALGLAAGAFGTHILRSRLTPEMLVVFDTGVRYQLVHALGLIGVAWATTRWPGMATLIAGWLFLAGTLLFSGSLYALALSGAIVFGAITPLGGLALIAGWLVLAWGVWQRG